MTHTVAITGAGGFIGAQAARRYAAMGWQVRGLDLPGISQPHVHETLTGNITDPDALAQLVNGADLVLHTAAIVAESGDWSAFHQINAAAPELVAIAAKTAGVHSFVHLSSVMVHGFDYPDGSTEDAAFDAADNPYCWSKVMAEHALRGLDDPGIFNVHIIRPGDVYGPGSVPWVVRPIQHMHKRTFLYVDPRSSVINHVYIDNLLEAIDAVVAAGDAVSGQAFIITDGQRTLARDYFGWFAEQVGSQRHIALPGWLAESIVGGLAAALPKKWAQSLDLDRQSIRYLRRRGVFDVSRIRALGWAPRVDLNHGRELTAAWLRDQQLLPVG